VCDIVVTLFTFAISSPDEFLYLRASTVTCMAYTIRIGICDVEKQRCCILVIDNDMAQECIGLHCSVKSSLSVLYVVPICSFSETRTSLVE